MDFLNKLDVEIIVAVISTLGIILAAIINGVFSLLCSSKKKNDKAGDKSYTINQTLNGSNNTLIGIQNNKIESEE